SIDRVAGSIARIEIHPPDRQVRKSVLQRRERGRGPRIASAANRSLDHTYRARRHCGRGDPQVLIVLPGHVDHEALITGHLRDEINVAPARAAVCGDVEEATGSSPRNAVQIGRADAEVVRARTETSCE